MPLPFCVGVYSLPPDIQQILSTWLDHRQGHEALWNKFGHEMVRMIDLVGNRGVINGQPQPRLRLQRVHKQQQCLVLIRAESGSHPAESPQLEGEAEQLSTQPCMREFSNYGKTPWATGSTPSNPRFGPYYNDCSGSITVPGHACVYSVRANEHLHRAPFYGVVYSMYIMSRAFNMVLTDGDLQAAQVPLRANGTKEWGAVLWEQRYAPSLRKELLELWMLVTNPAAGAAARSAMVTAAMQSAAAAPASERVVTLGSTGVGMQPVVAAAAKAPYVVPAATAAVPLAGLQAVAGEMAGMHVHFTAAAAATKAAAEVIAGVTFGQHMLSNLRPLAAPLRAPPPRPPPTKKIRFRPPQPCKQEPCKQGKKQLAVRNLVLLHLHKWSGRTVNLPQICAMVSP